MIGAREEKTMRGMSRKERVKGRSHSSEGYRKGELAKEILLMIAAGVAIPAALLMPNTPIALKPLLRALTERWELGKTKNFVRSITCLKRRRLVSVGEKDGQQILTLSENGNKRVLQFDLDKIVIRRPRKWDGYWRLILFDIPERQKLGREALRSKLKQLGFYQLQKSCFIHPFDCKSEIVFISEIFEVAPYVNFIKYARKPQAFKPGEEWHPFEAKPGGTWRSGAISDMIWPWPNIKLGPIRNTACSTTWCGYRNIVGAYCEAKWSSA
jgi:hypothetical protein